MLLSEVQIILKADVLAGDGQLDKEVLVGCGSDLMSDVLAFAKEKALLITGILNTQVIRTAEMLDLRCVVFARGKTPTKEIVDLAIEKNIVVMKTKYSLFQACGLLYSGGLKGDLADNDYSL